MSLDPFFQDSHIFHRSFSHKPLHVVAADGLTLTLDDGRKILDVTGGPAVACLGHNQPEVAKAVLDQLSKVGYLFSGGGYSESATEELASLLLKDTPGGLSKAIFLNSGSEATDATIKLVVQYWNTRGQPQRRNFIARKQSYHGNTLGGLSMSGHQSRRAMYADFMTDRVSFVDPCYAYRCKLDNETDEMYVQRLKQQLDDEFQALSPDTVAAFFAETIAGSTLACVPAEKGYFQAVREVCDKYGALLVLDEVMCGMGRSGTMHAWQQEGIRGPDIQTIGKSLGGGFIPLSAVLVHQQIFDSIANGSGALAGGHTFQAHPVSCAAALQVQKIIRRDNLLENVRRMGVVLENLLKTEIAPLPLVGNVRGRGLFWAVEFMLDKSTRTPFPLGDDVSTRIKDAALEEGVNVLSNMGFAGMHKIDTAAITPPFTVTEGELVEAVQRLKRAIVRVSKPYLAARETVCNGEKALGVVETVVPVNEVSV
ncbi:hypothetical protein A1O3_05246 [Capronia epimyces CBS 606.96]|uniref:Aminotransferase n=1 Tax=Capronia epimyces CBS 606.96 TaxID=1182542 RepID=W9Y5S7_9EURO|nr:uncharacterized protein A1O3_05246 [Capronia epimyces CBS 606.96]EXJ84576.1 hypothetical protein A1O3_05246 [Capronia epimyces CBS 606.96]